MRQTLEIKQGIQFFLKAGFAFNCRNNPKYVVKLTVEVLWLTEESSEDLGSELTYNIVYVPDFLHKLFGQSELQPLQTTGVAM